MSFPEVFDPGRYRSARGFELYLEAASLAASRAFFIGDVFGEALVPVADAFNHRTDAESVRVFGADAEASAEDSGEEVFSGDERSNEEESSDRSSESSGDASSSSLPSIDPYDAPVAGALVVELLLQLLLQLLRLLQRGDERLGARRAAGALVDRPQPLLPLGLAQLQPLVDAAAAADGRHPAAADRRQQRAAAAATARLPRARP